MSKDLFEREPSIIEEVMESLIFGFEYAHPEKAKTCTCAKNAGRSESIYLDQSSFIGETVEEFIFGFDFAHPEKASGQTAREAVLEERRQQVKSMRSGQGLYRDKERGR